MDSTAATLLQRICQTPSEETWERFSRTYRPLLLHWARRLGLQDHDAADLVQDVMIVLLRKLPDFQYRPEQSFRGWMRTVLINKWRDRRRDLPTVPLDDAGERTSGGHVEEIEEKEFRQHRLGWALNLIKVAFEPTTWQAYWETVVAGRPVANVANEMGLSINAVYLARSRVAGRLRRELPGSLG